jgi:hypothetical protein
MARIEEIMSNTFIVVSEYGTEKKYVPVYTIDLKFNKIKSFDKYVRINGECDLDDSVGEDCARRAILGAEKIFVEARVDRA